MKTIDNLPRLVVIDDNQDFLDQLRDQGLEQYFVTDLISIKNVSDGSPGLDRIVQRVGDFLPDHLLLDINLQRPGDSQLILQRLGERQALSDQCRIWLISQAFQPKTAEDMLHPFQGIDANVQNIVLPKPISIRRLWAELTDQALYEPHPQWQNFPLPLRILSQTGKVLHTNQHWWRPEYPDPNEFFQQGRRIPCKEFTGSYYGEKKSGFSVHTFPLEQEGQSFLAQVVEIHPLEPVVTNLKQTLAKVFHTMELAGYRGRFYRLRPLAKHKDEKVYNQVLELVSLSYQADLSLPYRMPLKGWLKTSLDEYKFDPKGSLAYRIRTFQDEPKDGPYLSELKKRLDLIDLKSSLEMPVWVRRRDSTKESAVTTDEPSHEIAAWLIFDRHHRSNPSSSGAVGDEVDTRSVQPLLPLLGSLVVLVAAAIRRERLQELADHEARMRKLDQQLLEKDFTNEQRLNALLDALCDLSGATSGVLRVKDDFDKCLKIAALKVDDRLRFLQDIRIPLAADYHPIVKAWHRREPFACQDFASGEPKEQLMEALHEAKDPHLQALSPKHLQEYIRWVDEDIKALLAIPILLPPDTKIGIITLQFTQPFSITQHHKEQIDAVLQRARWMIQQYQDDKEERLMWHQILSHELKTYLSTTVTELKELARQNISLEKNISYRQAHLHAIEAMDLAENWMDSHRSKESVTPSGSAFSPLAIIKEYLNINIYRIEQDSIELQQTPSWADERWDSRLDGDAQKFGRVVRVLLDNAFRHGREYLGVASSRVVPVSLEVEVTDGRWLLTITNPGQMDANAYYYRFHPGAVPNKPVPGGSHVGLYAARYLVGLYGGDLSLENMPKNLVQARLSWPLTINTAGR